MVSGVLSSAKSETQRSRARSRSTRGCWFSRNTPTCPSGKGQLEARKVSDQRQPLPLHPQAGWNIHSHLWAVAREFAQSTGLVHTSAPTSSKRTCPCPTSLQTLLRLFVAPQQLIFSSTCKYPSGCNLKQLFIGLQFSCNSCMLLLLKAISRRKRRRGSDTCESVSNIR